MRKPDKPLKVFEYEEKEIMFVFSDSVDGEDLIVTINRKRLDV